MARKPRNTQVKNRRDTLFDNIQPFKPLTNNQARAAEGFQSGKNLCLTGYAGTGKTYIALHNALTEYLAGTIDHISIYRTAVQTVDIGFLPGTEAEKMAPFEAPYIQIVNKILGRADAYQILKTKGILSFDSTSFLRGITLDKCCVVVDEAQNLDKHEVNTIMTRLGKGTRVILCGDIRQSDVDFQDSGLGFLRMVLKRLGSSYFTLVDMGKEDIVRSGLVKAWIIAAEEYESEQKERKNKGCDQGRQAS